MDNQKIKSILIQTAAAAAGSLGIVSVLFTKPAINVYSAMIYVIVTAAACVAVPCMSLKKISVRFNAVFCSAFAVCALILHRKLIRGIDCIAGDLSDLFLYGRELVRSGNDGSGYSSEMLQRASDETAAMIMFSVLVAYLVSLIVVYAKSMALAIVSVLPLMTLFIFFAVIPSSVTIVLCISYVFCVAALNRKQGSAAAAGRVLVLGLAAGGILILADIGTDTYERPQVFVRWGERISAGFNKVFDSEEGFFGSSGGPFGGNNGRGAVTLGITNSGKIGEADIVEWDDKTIGIITTEYTGRSQYIGVFYSGDYQYGENVWSEDSYISGTDEAKLDVLGEIYASEELRDYVAGGGDFDSLFKVYYVSMSSGDIDIGDGHYIDDIDESIIYRIANVVNGNASVETQLSSRYVRNMGSEKRRAENSFLDIDGTLKEEIEGLIGSFPTDTLQQKLYYINYVQNYLKNNYVYTTSPGHVPEGRDAAEYFLTESKEGYCTYFATAAVMMFRAAGLPARYVEGYVVPSYRVSGGAETSVINRWAQKSGIKDYDMMLEARNAQVRNSDAHAWVEVYLDGYGWRTVEVTPSIAAGHPEGNAAASDQIADTGEEETAAEDTAVDGESAAEEETAEIDSQPADNSSEQEVSGGDGLSNSAGTRWKIIIIAMAAVFVVIFTVSRIIKRRKLRFMLDSYDITGIYSALERLISCAGYVRPDYMDYEEYAQYLESSDWIFERYNIRMITDTVLAVRFGGGGAYISKEQEKVFKEAAESLRQSIYMRMNPVKRLFVKYILII